MVKKITRTEVDLVFTKVKPKGKRRIDFEHFHEGMRALARSKYGSKYNSAFDKDKGVEKLLKHLKDKTFDHEKEATKKKKVGGVTDRLTDTSRYGGTHKLRFDKEGKGRGLDGRDQISGSKGPPSAGPFGPYPGDTENVGNDGNGFDGTDFAVGTSMGYHHNKKQGELNQDPSIQIYTAKKPQPKPQHTNQTQTKNDKDAFNPGLNAFGQTFSLFNNDEGICNIPGCTALATNGGRCSTHQG